MKDVNGDTLLEISTWVMKGRWPYFATSASNCVTHAPFHNRAALLGRHCFPPGEDGSRKVYLKIAYSLLSLSLDANVLVFENASE